MKKILRGSVSCVKSRVLFSRENVQLRRHNYVHGVHLAYSPDLTVYGLTRLTANDKRIHGSIVRLTGSRLYVLLTDDRKISATTALFSVYMSTITTTATVTTPTTATAIIVMIMIMMMM